MAAARALADETRADIAFAVGRRAMRLPDRGIMQLAPSTVSKHLALLEQASLVAGRKEGRWMFYRLAERDATPEARAFAVWRRSGSPAIRPSAGRQAAEKNPANGPRRTMQEAKPLIKVLFLCTGNSCRSQMAEGWARHLKCGAIEPYSAGIEAHGLNPRRGAGHGRGGRRYFRPALEDRRRADRLDSITW